MILVVALTAFAAFAVVTVAAIVQWILAARNRVPGMAWWKIGIVGRTRFTEQGRRHRRRF